MLFWWVLYIFGSEVIYLPDETITGYAPRDVSFRLIELDGVPIDTTTHLRFTGRKQMTLRTPCFAYRGRVKVPTPWFDYEPGATTEYACLNLPIETAIHDALQDVSFVEIGGRFLLFSDDTGPRMVFRSDQD